jgi:hypothetical protein
MLTSYKLHHTSHGPPNTGDKLPSGAPVHVAGGGAGRHLVLPFGCRPELRQLHPLDPHAGPLMAGRPLGGEYTRRDCSEEEE